MQPHADCCSPPSSICLQCSSSFCSTGGSDHALRRNQPFSNITPAFERRVEMKSKSNSEETSVARFPLKMQNEATGFAEHRCRTMRNQESNRSEVAMSGLAVGPGEMGGLMKLTAIARKRVRIISGMILALSLVPIAHGEQDVVTAVHASIQRVDSAAKTT